MAHPAAEEERPPKPINSGVRLSISNLLRVLDGVAAATILTEQEAVPAMAWVLAQNEVPQNEPAGSQGQMGNIIDNAFLLNEWLDRIASNNPANASTQEIVKLALAVAFLRQKSRLEQETTGEELEQIWALIRDALFSTIFSRPGYSASRSAQGFLALPLCCLINENKTIAELFRLHVWMPDGVRGNPQYSIHSHQPYARSWILAGQGTDTAYTVEPASDPSVATHAEFALRWKSGEELGQSYSPHQQYSVVENTGKLVCAIPGESVLHTRDMTYSVPAGAFHTSNIPSDEFHATLFFFDSQRKFIKDAPVLGPIDGKSFKQDRNPAGVTPIDLVKTVDAFRAWEELIQRGQDYAQCAEWEYALREFNKALDMCSVPDFPASKTYRLSTLLEFGNTNRRFGRYELAKKSLQMVVDESGTSVLRINASGELGVIYRHMNLLDDAKEVIGLQLKTAKELNSDTEICRALGNLGMINYQLSQQRGDMELLDMAISQLKERVSTARKIKESTEAYSLDGHIESRLVKYAITRESIGLARLSLCYTARDELAKAAEFALQSLNIAATLDDPTVIAMSRFFYGRVLLRNGQREEALKQFNTPGTCTPAIALCKEPSEEHGQYLRELVDVGADMDLTDEQGYKALDCAVYNNDTSVVDIVLDGLRKQLHGDVPGKLKQSMNEARLRKNYREIFQDRLRPVLNHSNAQDRLRRLRRAYAEILADDVERRRMFDGLKFVRYSHFERSKRIPRSSDKVTYEWSAEFDRSHPGARVDFVIFLSYRWIGKESGLGSQPDDQDNTQYRRMISAIEEFLTRRPDVDRNTLGIWVDLACIDQDHAASGISALPMVLMQCNVVISLVDGSYYSRAWCCVEVLMIQTLIKSYGLHRWYEQVHPDGSNQIPEDNTRWILREASLDRKIVVAEKDVSFAEDRPKLMFLERQTKMLG